jgi:hypothetical protein
MTALLATFLSGEGVAALSQCDRVSIPLHLDSATKDFEVTGSWLFMEAAGTLRGEISLRNQTDKSLSRLTVMVNYLDENGSILFSIPYQANLLNEENDIRNIRPFSELRLNGPVQPGEVVTLVGRNLLSITTVPSSAEVVYWFAKHYEDGSSVSNQIGQHGFRTDPLPAESFETLVKMQINEYGRVLEIQSGREGDTGLTGEQFEALSKQLAEWHFFPGIENGYAVQSDLYLLVEFVPENPLPIRRCFREHPAKYVSKFALVTLQPIRDSSNRWILNYGSFPADSIMERNIIEIGTTAVPVDQ